MYRVRVFTILGSVLISACAAPPSGPPQAPTQVDQIQYDYDWNDCMLTAQNMMEAERDDYMQSNRRRRNDQDGSDPDAFGDDLYDRDFGQLEGSIADDSVAMMHFRQCMVAKGHYIRN